MVRALFTNVSLFTFLEDNYELFCVSLYYTYTKFLLSFSLSLSVSLLFQYLNLCFFLCVLGFVGTKFCTALSLCLWWVFYKRNFVCVFLTLSIYLWWATSVWLSRFSRRGYQLRNLCFSLSEYAVVSIYAFLCIFFSRPKIAHFRGFVNGNPQTNPGITKFLGFNPGISEIPGLTLGF